MCFDNDNQIREVGSHNNKYLPASNISFSSKYNANTYCMLLVYLGNPDYGQYEDVNQTSKKDD